MLILSADAMDINLFPTISENDSEEDSQDNLQLEDVSSDSLNSDAQKLYKNLMGNSMTVADVCKMNTIDKIHSKLQIKVNSLASSENASLWLQYMEMINILRKFIRVERTGNWGLHLQALFEMLSFLAASGHNNYTKSLWIYLKQMSSLKDDCPVVYDHFQNGFHVVRSVRFWGGLSTDLIIEQVLMRSMKTSVGLIRGRGMTENQRLIWAMAMPSCAEINRTITTYNRYMGGVIN